MWSRTFLLSAAMAACALSARAGTPDDPAPGRVDWSLVETIVQRIQRPRIPGREYRVLRPAGGADARPAILAAIAKAADEGGGRVVLSRGLWRSDGPIHLKSRIDLHLEEGATLRFSPEPAHYLPVVKTRWEGTEVLSYSPLVYARDVEDVAITGRGTIDGNAESRFHAWHAVAQPDFVRLRKLGFAGAPLEERVFGPGTHLRPSLVQILGGRRILLEGYTARNSPFWVNHLVYVEHATVRDIRVESHFPNNDGVDVDSSRYVLVERSTFRTGDDSVVVKSGRDLDGRRIGRPSEYVVVRDNDMGGEDGIALGSEMSGGIRYVFFTDNVLRSGTSAIRFKANLDRGGTVEHVGVRRFKVGSFGKLLWFQLDYPGELGGNFPATYRDLVFEDMEVGDVETLFEAHAPAAAPLRDVVVRNVSVAAARQPVIAQNVSGLRFENVRVAGQRIDALAAPYAGASGATYRNPVLFADYSDPDVVRVGEDYYMTASSFQAVPGLPILHSRDLVSWRLVGHAAPRLPSPDFDRAQHGNGLWAPSLRHHDGWFWIYVGDPDRGLFLTRARDPAGPWEPLTLVQEAKGWIDPCPLWDADGSLYLVHAWAKSRAGFNGVLTVRRLSPDGRRVIGEGINVFDGRDRHPTIEGPKFHRRGGWYYIFAPAGGVKTGWQAVLRSRSVLGPYEDAVVLEQGRSLVNGPHQGAWVETPSGEDWFLHFQDRGAYGRIVHLQPMAWRNEWPVIGEDRDGDGRGEPVVEWTRPRTSGAPAPPEDLPRDEFDQGRLGLHWQWHGNPAPAWASLSARPGFLRVAAVPHEGSLWPATHLLLQKFPAPAFTATARVDPRGLRVGERAGLVVMGTDYALLAVERTATGFRLRRATAKGADRGGAEAEEDNVAVDAAPLHLRVSIAPQAVARFSSSVDGRVFTPRGTAFLAQPGRWIGAKVGLVALAPAGAAATGHVDVDAFTLEADAAARAGVVVAADGSGDFPTVQAALDAVPTTNETHRTIVVKSGVYREKVFLDAAHVSLVGEERDTTRLEFAELRRNWRATHPDDRGAAVVNIGPKATDLVLANLTVVNDYGLRHGDDDHQFAIRAMGEATRIALLDVTARSGGGDTVSLWNAAGGLTYYADSSFEGHVDYLCPRGWAYVTGSRFYGRNLSASLWHDGSGHRDQKLVVRHSYFDGVPGFPLGRHHRDAQFYLLDARFSANMADRPIYAAAAPDPLRWGTRAYYANAHREGGDFAWFADNLHLAEGAPRDEDVTATWTFGGRWNPETLPPALSPAAIPGPENGWRWADPGGVTLRWTPGRDARAHRVFFGPEDPPAFRGEQSPHAFDTGPLVPGATYHWRVDTVTAGGVVPGRPWSFRADDRTVRIVLAGDSTVTETSGWGRGFKARVAGSAAVVNLARGGRSSRTYRSEGHWAEVLRRRPTHVLLQFGHNDQPGKGPDRESDPPAYRANLERYVDEARAAGAVPVVVTPLARRRFGAGGRIESDLLAYADAARAVARDKAVPCIDLHALSVELLDAMGPERGRALGPVKTDGTPDNTHLNDEGSALFGARVAGELARLLPALAVHIRLGAR